MISNILLTITFATLGYLIGSVLSSVLVVKLLKLDDIRTKGSGNPGATNATRIHGVKIGFIVFFLDFIKPIIAVSIATFSLNNSIIIQIVAIATLLGHVFSIFHKFKGGKGISCLLGVVIMMNWTLFIIAIVIFLSIVIITKKSSLGSLVFSFAITILYPLLSQIKGYNDRIFEPITYDDPYWINSISIAGSFLVVIWSHRLNIKKLLQNQEFNYN